MKKSHLFDDGYLSRLQYPHKNVQLVWVCLCGKLESILKQVFCKMYFQNTLNWNKSILNTKIQNTSFEVFQIQNIKYKKLFKYLFEI